MSKVRVFVAGVLAALCVVGGTMVATGSSQSNGGDALQAPERGGVANISAKYSRASAVVGQGGELVASKGVVKVNVIDVGTFCVLLKNKDIKAARTVPQATVEWGMSSGFDLDVQWYRAAPDCPNTQHWIEIMTFTEPSAGSWEFSDLVAWNLIVP